MGKKMMKINIMFIAFALLFVFATSTNVKAATESYVVDGVTYNQVKTNEDLTEGKYLIQDKTQVAFMITNGPAAKFIDITKNLPENNSILELIKSDTSFFVKAAFESKYLEFHGGPKENVAYFVPEMVEAAKWNLTIKTDGTVEMKNVATPTRFMKYNVSSPRFACYLSGQVDLLFFKAEASAAKPAGEIFELNKVESSLNINYKKNYLQTEAVQVATSDSAGNNMLASPINNANKIRLDANQFMVSSILSQGAVTHIGTYPNEIRIYGNNTLVIENLKGKILKIVLEGVDKADFKIEKTVDDVLVELTETTTGNGEYLVDSAKIMITNKIAGTKVLSKITLTTDGLNEAIIEDAQLRFGTRISSIIYDALILEDASTKFGTLYYIKTEETKSLKEMYANSNSLEEFLAANSTIKNAVNTPARVDGSGAAAADGSFYQFATVLKKILPANYATEIVAANYVIVNGKVYFTQDRVESVKSTANLYLSTLPNDASIIKHSLALKVLAEFVIA